MKHSGIEGKCLFYFEKKLVFSVKIGNIWNRELNALRLHKFFSKFRCFREKIMYWNQYILFYSQILWWTYSL